LLHFLKSLKSDLESFLKIELKRVLKREKTILRRKRESFLYRSFFRDME
jgi:hypothetical protein